MDLFWIERGLAVVTRPRGGDGLADELAELAAAGVDVLVSCLPRDEERDLGLEGERTAAAGAGMHFVSVPVPDMGTPPDARRYDAAVEELAALRAAGRSVAIHCRMSYGRAPMLAAALLALDGSMTPVEAWTRIGEKRGRRAPETEPQGEWIAAFAARRSKPPR